MSAKYKRSIGLLFVLSFVIVGCSSDNQWTLSTTNDPSSSVQRNPDTTNFYLEEEEMQLNLEESFNVVLENTDNNILETSEYYDFHYYEDDEWIPVRWEGFTPDVIRTIEPDESKEFTTYLNPPLPENTEGETETGRHHEYEEGIYRLEKEISWEDSEEIEAINLFFELQQFD